MPRCESITSCRRAGNSCLDRLEVAADDIEVRPVSELAKAHIQLTQDWTKTETIILTLQLVVEAFWANVHSLLCRRRLNHFPLRSAMSIVCPLLPASVTGPCVTSEFNTEHCADQCKKTSGRFRVEGKRGIWWMVSESLFDHRPRRQAQPRDRFVPWCLGYIARDGQGLR